MTALRPPGIPSSLAFHGKLPSDSSCKPPDLLIHLDLTDSSAYGPPVLRTHGSDPRIVFLCLRIVLVNCLLRTVNLIPLFGRRNILCILILRTRRILKPAGYFCLPILSLLFGCLGRPQEKFPWAYSPLQVLFFPGNFSSFTTDSAL